MTYAERTTMQPPTSVTGRLALLTTATGLFMGLWITDRAIPTRRQTVTSGWENQSGGTQKLDFRIPVVAGNFRMNVVNDHPLNSVEPVSQGSIEQSWKLEDIPSRLPQDISAGDYRVVSQLGTVWKLSLTEDDLSLWKRGSTCVVRDLYSVSTSTNRWYYIRIESEERPEGFISQPVRIIGHLLPDALNRLSVNFLEQLDGTIRSLIITAQSVPQRLQSFLPAVGQVGVGWFETAMNWTSQTEPTSAEQPRLSGDLPIITPRRF